MWIVQAICIIVVLGVGLFIVAKRSGAAPPPAKAGVANVDASAKPAPAPPAKPGAKGAKAAASASASASAAPPPPPPPAAKKDDDKDGGADDPVNYAEVQTEDDFPKDISEEEKNSIGTGKVPIHKEGPYKSPLAHPRFGGATHVKVGLVIKEIREFNIQTGGFEAELFLSLTGDKELPNLNLTFTNGHEINFNALVDSPTFKFYAVSGKFTTDIDLRQYPFDSQDLDFELEDSKAGIDQILFEPDQNRTSLDSGFKLTGFGVGAVGAIAYKHKYPPRFDRDDLYVSRYKFTLTLDRFATSAAFSVYVPAFIIVLISLTGMWVPPEELEVRSNAGAPMLAAAVLFHYSLIQSLPATGYLTAADKLMLGVYVSLLLNMGSTWALMLGDEKWMETVFKRARVFVPILTAVVMILACVV